MMPLVLLGIESLAREPAAARTLWLCALGTLVVFWLQPWQGATLLLIVVPRWRRSAGGARGERPPLALAADPGGGRRAGDLLLRALARRPRLEARLGVERRRRAAALVLALVGDRAHDVPARDPGGARLPAAGARRGRTWRCASGRSRALVVYLLPRRHLPLPRDPGPGPAARHPRRAGRGQRAAAPAARARGGRAVPADRARASSTSSSCRGTTSRTTSTRTTSSTTSSARSTGSSAIRARAACWRPSTRATWCPTDRPRDLPGRRCPGRPTTLVRLAKSNPLFDGRLPARESRAFVRGIARALPARELPAVGGPQARCSGRCCARTHDFGCATVYELRVRPEMARAAGAPDE